MEHVVHLEGEPSLESTDQGQGFGKVLQNNNILCRYICKYA